MDDDSVDDSTQVADTIDQLSGDAAQIIQAVSPPKAPAVNTTAPNSVQGAFNLSPMTILLIIGIGAALIFWKR